MPLEKVGVWKGVRSDVGDERMSIIVKPLEVKQPLVLYNNNMIVTIRKQELSTVVLLVS